MTTKSLVNLISVVSVICVIAFAGVMLSRALRTPTEQAPDRNGPRVVRVSIVEGSVVVQRGDSHVQTDAVRNAPMLPGDYISTGNTSRAELQFDGYTAVRLGEDVQARIVDDNPSDRNLQLADGTIEVGMVRDGRTMQIDTPSVTVRTRQAGDFRVSIAADGSSWITARRGGVDVVVPQRTYTLGTGSTLIARGSASDPSITYGPEVAFDGFDDFNAERDKTMMAALNASLNLNPSIAGYDDLDAYGHWQAVAGYGESWVPNEAAGWVPYRNGSWSWEGRYGWTWIGSEPWGWTPYHYGNWYYCGCGASGWAWLPPAYAATPAWSPALVGFFGFDTGAVDYNNCVGNYGYAPGSYSGPPAAPSGNTAPAAPYGSGAPAPYGVGGPGNPGPYYPPASPYGSGYPTLNSYPYPYIGWVPIAPYEPFYPWYPGWASIGFGWGSPTHITDIRNITNVTRIYRNFRHGGATATTMRNFRHGTVFGHTLAVTTHDLGRRFGTIHGALPVAPTRKNLAFSHGTVHATTRFSKVFDSPRFASERALAARTSFAQQQKAVAQTVHAGLTRHANASAAVGRANAPASRVHVAATRMNAPTTRANIAETRADTFQTRGSPLSRENVAGTRMSAITHSSRPETHTNAFQTRESPQVGRENGAPAIRGENSEMMRENSAPMREGSAASSQVEATRNESVPSASWGRFNEARGEAGSSEFAAGSERATSADTREADVSAREAGRGEQAPSDSWGRFSSSRGESDGSARNPYIERESSPSYAHETPSYSRGSYGSPYSRGSYPSYSRGSYPSYSRGSYGSSYSRGSYPSYSHGSYGSGPSYSHGNSAPSHSSGGGDRHGGGGRPPQ
ncbi:MAG TPA: DUF6600 domain-containing protein [Candidatus Cybelea sp.]|nr:DUF6600 domain-containing protein [Candidatus Cybelea sp.]